MYYLRSTYSKQKPLQRRQAADPPYSLQTVNRETPYVYEKLLHSVDQQKFPVTTGVPNHGNLKTTDIPISASERAARKKVYEIPITRYTKAQKTDQWDVSVQTGFSSLHSMTAVEPPPMQSMFEDIGLAQRSIYANTLWESLAEPRNFCASVDGISQITAINDCPATQEPGKASPTYVDTKCTKCVLKKNEGAINGKCQLSLTKAVGRLDTSAAPYNDKTCIVASKSVGIESSNRIDASDKENVLPSSICGKFKCQLVKAVESKLRQSPTSEVKGMQEQLYPLFEGTRLAKQKRLSGSSPDLSSSSIKDLVEHDVEESSDPDWCYDLVGTNDDTSVSEATPDSEQLVRGNMLFRFANVAKRKRILSSENVSVTDPESCRGKFFNGSTEPLKNKNFFSPSFLSKPRNITVNPGENAKFFCSCVGFPIPDVSWYLHDNKLVNDTRTKIKSRNGNHYLEIENVLPEESGTIKCLIENVLGKSEVYAQLWVNDPFLDLSNKTLRILTPLKNVEIPEGGNVAFKCKVFGKDFDIRWYHNGKVIVPDDKRIIDFKLGCTTLEMRDLKCHDTGVITCLVTNMSGEDKSSCMLRVTSGTPVP